MESALKTQMQQDPKQKPLLDEFESKIKIQLQAKFSKYAQLENNLGKEPEITVEEKAHLDLNSAIVLKLKSDIQKNQLSSNELKLKE